jgi:hypothetical protein
MKTIVLVSLQLMLFSLLFLSPLGCGMSTTFGVHGDSLEEIQSLEQDIEAQIGISHGGGECQDRCRAAESICTCAGRICEVARDLAELSALESCRRAEEHCHEARRRVAESCSCE